MNPNPYNDYTSYGTPTVVGTDTGSRPMSINTNVGAKPRPFVQAYNPEQYNDPNYHGETNTGYDTTSHYYDYSNQHYGPQNTATNYTHDQQYYAGTEPMMNASTGGSSGRNVPDEVDYPRHVPNEIDTVTPPHTK